MVLAADAGGNGGARMGAALGCSLGPSPDSPSLAQRKAAELGRECSAETVSFLSQSYSRGLLKGKKRVVFVAHSRPLLGRRRFSLLRLDCPEAAYSTRQRSCGRNGGGLRCLKSARVVMASAGDTRQL